MSAGPANVRLGSALDRVSAICAEFQLASLQPQIDACRELLAEEADIDVAVIGSFKAGKSSFLNGLAGTPVLPVGVVPVTAVITKLCYGSQEQAIIRYEDGRAEPVPVERLAEFVSESENPENEKQIASVTARLPGLKAYAGLNFVDTPGSGGALRHNTETSADWLPNVGVALIAIGAERPLSEQDIVLIREVARYTPRLVILLTKVDLLSESQAKEVTHFVIHQMRRQLGMTVPVYPYSIRQDQALHEQCLREKLLGPLAHGRNEAVAEVALHKLNTLATEGIGYLEVGLAAARVEEDRRNRLEAQVLGEQHRLEATLDELHVLVEDCINRTHPQILEIFEPHRRALHEKLRADLLLKLPAWRMNLWRLCRTYEAWLADVLGREVADISQTEADAILEPYRQAEERINRHVTNFRARLADNLEKALGVKMPATRWEAQVGAPQRPDVSVAPSLDIHIDLLWFLVPMRLFGPAIHRHLLHQLPWEAEKNLTRLAAQWAERINGKIMELESQAAALIRGEIATVQALLAQQPDKVLALEAARGELARMRENLVIQVKGERQR
jgi:GTP-binding protein EngB required for normal cell division